MPTPRTVTETLRYRVHTGNGNLENHGIEKCKFQTWRVLDFEIKSLKCMEYINKSLKDIDLEIRV